MPVSRSKNYSCQKTRIVSIVAFLLGMRQLPIVKADWIDPDTPLSAFKTRLHPNPTQKKNYGSILTDKSKKRPQMPSSSPSNLPTFSPSESPSIATTKENEERTDMYHLVMSDEFNIPGRTFEDGSDSKWTALEKNDYTNNALHYYSASNAFTDENGDLVIKTEAKDKTFIGFNDTTGKKEVTTKHFHSAMLQSWNKFCFTGGIIETEVQLPGLHNVGGLWPAFWLLGNIARHTYVGSTNHVWPWSSNVCTEKARNAQRINGCSNVQHFGLQPKIGRGAPEIDIFEVQAGNIKANIGPFLRTPVGQPYMSASYQVAPGRQSRPWMGHWPGPGQWYSGLTGGVNTSLNINFYGTYNHFKNDGDGGEKDYWSDAVSYNHQLDESHFTKKHKYRLEWELQDDEEGGADGFLRWYIDGKFVLEINGTGIVDAGLGSSISTEPMYIILNTAVSKEWGFSECPANCECKKYDCNSNNFHEKCGFPNGFCEMLQNETAPSYKINWIRVYQNPNVSRQKVGCSTPERPTRKYIEGHEHLYKTKSDKKALKDIVSGGGMCSRDVTSDLKSSCGGPARGTCSASRLCECRAGWVGFHCLSHDSFDPVSYDRSDGFQDLEFAGPYFFVFVLGSLFVTVFVIMTVIPVIQKKRDGYSQV